MATKKEVSQIIGKTISGVVIKKIKAEVASFPQCQLFLTFDDNTAYEFFCHIGEIKTTGGLLPSTSLQNILNNPTGAHYPSLIAQRLKDNRQASCNTFDE